MNLIRLSIRRPILVSVFFLALGVLGLVSLFRLRVSMIPNINIPVITIKTVYPGAGPDQVETLITKPVEDALSTTNGLDHITSASLEGVSIVIGRFTMDVRPDVAAADVREKVASIRGRLPDDAKDPEVSKVDINASPILYLACSGENLRDIYDRAVNDIKPALQTSPGVGDIVIVGGLKREIRVEAFPDRLRYYQVDLTSLASRLATENVNIPSGRYKTGEREVSGRLDSEFTDPREIASLDIPVFEMSTGKVRTVPLSSIATVRDTHAEIREKAFVNRRNAVALIIQKQADANTVQVVDALYREISRLRKTLPKDMELSVVVDTSVFIRESVADVRGNLYVGVLIVAVVLFLFLHSIGSTFIIALTIPVALIGTLFFMFLAGYSLNVLTLSSLTLCVGIMISSAIVVLENIHRYRNELGKPLLAAAEEGTTEVFPAVLASILTNIVVFVPIAFMSGIVGQFFREFGMVQIFATLITLAGAFTLIPMLASRIMTDRVESGWTRRWESGFGKIRHAYERFLPRILARPWLVFGLVAALLAASLFLVPIIGMELMTSPDQGISSIDIRMPVGTGLEKTEKILSVIQERLEQLPELERTFVTLGSISGGAIGIGSQGPEYARIIISWKKERKRSAQEITEEIKPFLAAIPGATITVTAVSSTVGRGGGPFQIYLTGSRWEDVQRSSTRLLETVRTTPGIVDADSSYHAGKPEINFVVKRDTAAEANMDASYLALNARAALEGLVPTTYREGENQYDIRVTIPEDIKRNHEVLGSLPLISSTRKMHYMKQFADIEESSGPSVKERYDREPAITISANINRPLGKVTAAFRERLKDFSFSGDAHIRSGGDITFMEDAFRDLLTAIAMATVLVYLVMAAQFESWLEPLIIMGTLPLAIIGILFGLLLFGKTISMFSLLGVVILTGVGVNNGILIIDFAKELFRKGLSPLEAVIQASSVRLRPQLITSCTTVASTIPLAFGMGEASPMKAPLGVTILSGAASATVLTLVVVPLLYHGVLARRQRRALRRQG